MMTSKPSQSSFPTKLLANGEESLLVLVIVLSSGLQILPIQEKLIFQTSHYAILLTLKWQKRDLLMVILLLKNQVVALRNLLGV